MLINHVITCRGEQGGVRNMYCLSRSRTNSYSIPPISIAAHLLYREYYRRNDSRNKDKSAALSPAALSPAVLCPAASSLLPELIFVDETSELPLHVGIPLSLYGPVCAHFLDQYVFSAVAGRCAAYQDLKGLTRHWKPDVSNTFIIDVINYCNSVLKCDSCFITGASIPESASNLCLSFMIISVLDEDGFQPL